MKLKVSHVFGHGGLSARARRERPGVCRRSQRGAMSERACSIQMKPLFRRFGSVAGSLGPLIFPSPFNCSFHSLCTRLGGRRPHQCTLTSNSHSGNHPPGLPAIKPLFVILSSRQQDRRQPATTLSCSDLSACPLASRPLVKRNALPNLLSRAAPSIRIHGFEVTERRVFLLISHMTPNQ
jgi:hypothetical protein